MNVDLKTFPLQANPVAKFFNESGTLIDTETGTESATVKGTYRFAPTLADGYYDYTIALPGDGSSAGAIQVSGQVVVNDGDTIARLRSEQAIKDSIESLSTTGAVTVVSPVDTTGKISGAIVIGDDYLAANSRSFVWTIPAITGVTVGTATAKFGGKKESESWLVAGTITVDGSNWILSFDLPRASTATLTEGHYAWSVKVFSASGAEITRVRSDKHLVQLVKGQA